MGYRIEKRGATHHVVDNDSGAVDSEHASHGAAVNRIQALASVLAEREKAERERLANDPAVKAQRRKGAAYRLAERDPMLRVLKRVLPRKGEVARNTQRRYEDMLKWMDSPSAPTETLTTETVTTGTVTTGPVKIMAAAASDPRVHAELNKSPTQRQTSKAVATRQRGRAAKEAQARALKKQGLPNTAIAKRLEVTPVYVSMLLKKKNKN